MSSSSVDERDVAGRNDRRHVLEQPGNNPLVRGRSRNVSENNADLRIGKKMFSEPTAFDRMIQRLQEALFLVLQAGNRNRLDNISRILRQIDIENPASVGKANCAGWVHSGGQRRDRQGTNEVSSNQ